eukprot:TRINITY_DN864_c0_g1_i2.p1 TRINITY_DN864_c0_g1~~TRINITY_DN864_c0_g1_i2.p1  ORF type:complete len:444 (+),score=88.20 TRINITY_DN864_c0_g1_i2:48-1334(+)
MFPGLVDKLGLTPEKMKEIAAMNKRARSMKKPAPPSTWPLHGHVRLSPSDDPRLYPSVIRKQDPAVWVPPAPGPKGVVAWQLVDDDDDSDEDDGMDDLSRMMGGVMAGNLYINKLSPYEQFCEVLEERKLKALKSNEAIQELINTKSFVLNIRLAFCEDYVWRRFRVPAHCSLDKLHDQIITPIMGYARAYHGYVFMDRKDGAVFGPKKYSGYIDMMHVGMHYHYVADDRKVPLAFVVQKAGDLLQYCYDLGDQWEHMITVEEVVSSDECQTAVELIDGRGAPPPEDSNGLKSKGPRAYRQLLEICKKTPKSAAVKQATQEIERSASNYTSSWLTGRPIKFKPFDYDLEFHRLMLRGMLLGPEVKKCGLVGSIDPFKEVVKSCQTCGERLKRLSRCAGCAKVFYCGRECQLKDWKAHKPQCKKTQAKK